jgi:5'-phosphate synthase pdxT subunit
VFIRAPWVESIGRGVEVLARVPGSVRGPASGKVVAVRQGAVMATAFHPEQTGDARLHDLFLQQVRALGLASAPSPG